MLNTKVRKRGCARTGTGIMEQPTPTTVLRKFAYVSASINHANKFRGFAFDNHALKVTCKLREMEK
jgi:hypothetical protein